ncbi:DNA-binding transcriptional activator of the SARP family [Micromonospora pattaloongensis]|uniref:DNA-binding transcriptional activator of the SARP family n=1 Tax=Micromonospora pattaloongensis TaxID=405436 RepID=A0A1H3PBD8_9ACTN|nr:DNA-binding transcriptional activator of the SARP family [Micromonospora pattaloongensis]
MNSIGSVLYAPQNSSTEGKVFVNLLGPLEILDECGNSITPAPAKMRALVALLSAHPGVVMTTQQMQVALWPDNPPRTATTAMQVYVSRLRKHLDANGTPQGAIATRPSGYVLDDGDYVIDHQVFRSLVRQADHAESENRIEDAVEMLQQALLLRRGPALADLRMLPALNAIGRRFDEQMLATFGRKAELELNLDRHARLIPELIAMAAEHPLHEHIHQLLMLCLYRSGRAAEALSIYARLRELLIDAAGLEPSATTQRLQHRILQLDMRLSGADALAA